MSSIAIIGYGYWGPKLVRNFLRDGSFNPVVIVEQDKERLKRGLRENPSARGVESFAAALQDPAITAVAIATAVAPRRASSCSASRQPASICWP